MQDSHVPGAAPDRAPTPRRSWAARTADIGVTTLAIGVSLTAVVAGVAALHLRAAADPPRQVGAPLTVATTAIRMQDGYERTVGHTGRLEAARQTSLAFERGGLVLAVAVDEGATVRRGDVVARLDTAALVTSRQQLEARRRELEAQRQLARVTLGRRARLTDQGFSPEQRRDEAETSVAQFTAAIEQVVAQLAAIDLDVRKSELVAPFDGTVAARGVDDGAVVSAGTAVVTLLETGRRQVRVGLPPAVARTLDPARTYTITAGDTRLEARLVARRPDIETGTRTVTVLLDVTGGADTTMLGDIVSLDIATTVPERGAWVPLTALKEGRRGLWTILTVDDGGAVPVVKPEAVELLHADAGRAYVRGTFRDGARVLVNGTDRVVAGQRVALARE
jgi:RND family efflux transporter MFP subunit